MTRRITASLPIAACAAFILLAACWLGTAHEVVARHVRCAEHGELVDAPEIAPHAGDRARVVAVLVGHADDHCAIAVAQRHDRAATASHLPMPLVSVAVTITVPHALPRRTVTLFRLAPKTSPPSIG